MRPPPDGNASTGAGAGPAVRPSPAELPDDFRAIDFRALWTGRDRTTQVESEIVRLGLRRFPVGRTIELGTGDGRLTPAVRSFGGEYIGVDQSVDFLRAARQRLPSGPGSLLIEANLYHLPLVDGCVSAGLLARVYNFLTSPLAALSEIRRALIPGGGLVLSCHPRPSTLTLMEDLRSAMSGRSASHQPSLTFSRARVLPIPPSPFPPPPLRETVRALVQSAGFHAEQTAGSGLEDSRLTRFLPARLFLAMGTGLGSAPVFPVEWEILRRTGSGVGGPLPPLSESVACPRCRRPFGPLDLAVEFERDCAGCGFPIRMERGILRARYVAS